MPSSDYGNAVGGGLKLKGGAKDAGIKKHKKKKPKVAEDDRVIEEDSTFGTELAKLEEGTIEPANKPEEEEAPREYVKTAAQRQHEERRKKRLDDRLKREGVKTHKERVEELNKYLSGLSEHHDMPRIGPG